MKKTKKDRIISYVKWRINAGLYEPSEKILSENALAIKFDCSRLTARSALQELKERKYIVSRKGKGYFVSLGRDKRTFTSVSNLGEQMHKFQVVHLKMSEKLRNKFENLGASTNKLDFDFKFNFIKTSFANSKPYTVLISYVNTSILEEIDVEEIKTSLSLYLSNRNISISKRHEIVFVEPVSDIVGIRLNLTKHALVVATYSVMYDENKNIIEFAVRYVIPSEFILKKTTNY